MVLQPDLNFNETATDVLDEKGFAGKWIDVNVDEYFDSYDTYKSEDVDVDEVIIHEGLGHGYFGGILSHSQMQHFLEAIRVGNIYRSFMERMPRSGETDHAIPTIASDPNQLNKHKPIYDVTLTPSELEKL